MDVLTKIEKLVKDKEIKDTLIVVAMSGGVDSSVVASVLSHLGYNVVGITLQLFDYGKLAGKKGTCCAGRDIYDAKRVADKMGFKHYVFNYESVFRDEVINDFADSYIRGETPIPCVRCNQGVKFRDLFLAAKKLGADALATGHYVKRIEEEDGFAMMARGFYTKKDQSYFLAMTTREQLEFLRFPLGGMEKSETRELARYFDLPVSDKEESQDICFVGKGGYMEVVKRMKPGAIDDGDIVDLEGNILGKHKGIIGYTVGQRKGLGLDTIGEAMYVVDIDSEKNRVIVGKEKDLYKDRVIIKELNWLGRGNLPEDGMRFKVKLRSMHDGVFGKIYKLNNDKWEVKLESGEKSITPGQACVLYDENEYVYGAGWIVKELH